MARNSDINNLRKGKKWPSNFWSVENNARKKYISPGQGVFQICDRYSLFLLY